MKKITSLAVYGSGVVCGFLTLILFFTYLPYSVFTLPTYTYTLVKGDYKGYRLYIEDVHVHHYVWGIVLMFLGGFFGYRFKDNYFIYMLSLFVVGFGSALFFDQFFEVIGLSEFGESMVKAMIMGG